MKTFDGYGVDMTLANGIHMYIGHVPERRGIAFGIYDADNLLDVLTYFRNVKAANKFLDILMEVSGSGKR